MLYNLGMPRFIPANVTDAVVHPPLLRIGCNKPSEPLKTVSAVRASQAHALGPGSAR